MGSFQSLDGGDIASMSQAKVYHHLSTTGLRASAPEFKPQCLSDKKPPLPCMEKLGLFLHEDEESCDSLATPIRKNSSNSSGLGDELVEEAAALPTPAPKIDRKEET